MSRAARWECLVPKRRASLMLLVTVLLWPTTVQARQVRISGLVQDLDGRPIVNGYVQIRAESQILLDRLPIIGGAFRVQFETNRRTVTVQVDAPGFQRRLVLVELNSDTVRLNPIRLRPLPGIRLGALVHHRTPDSLQEVIDVTIENTDARRDSVLTGFRFSATKRRETDCFDLRTPAVVFELPSTLSISEAGVVVRLTVHTNGTRDELSAVNRYTVLPCSQRRLAIAINLDLGVKAGERSKLRLVLPPVLERDGGEQPLHLESWEMVTLEVIEQNGRRTRTSEFRTNQP